MDNIVPQYTGNLECTHETLRIVFSSESTLEENDDWNVISKRIRKHDHVPFVPALGRREPSRWLLMSSVPSIQIMYGNRTLSKSPPSSHAARQA